MRILLLSLTILWIAGASPAFSEVFNHAEHNDYVDGAACDTCHLEGDASIAPDLKVCLECHEQDFVDGVELPALDSHGPTWAFGHRVAAKSDAMDCGSCHQQDYCLECHKAGSADEMASFSNSLANVHRSDFSVSHPIAARTDPQLCNSCHENDYCVECHNTFAPADLAIDSHRRGWSDISVSAASHENFTEDQCISCHVDSVLPAHEWSTKHAREARKNIATCQACHPEGDICLTCHSARSGLMINPHPEDWSDISETMSKASGGRTCRMCH
ncbi:MAG: cytochrome C [Desulfuromonas sp.]|nr:MAG: cytochrome C [Desulfuromonas sp.]